MDRDDTRALVERVRAATAARAPLRIAGGDTKRFYGRPVEGDVLETRGHAGILRHDPAELVLTARGGTPLADVEAQLAACGQRLPFEPPHFGAGATLGGAVAAGLSGPARAWAGPLRDFVLGVRLLTGDGRVLRFGGEVMKNVAGYDVARLLAGSLGILGVLLEPMTVIAKALEQVVFIGQRSFWEAKTVVVTGAGPIGLLAACAARLHGKKVHVLDRMESGVKPQLVRDLGATYHSGTILDLDFAPDVIVECTGVGSVLEGAVRKIGAGGVVCLTGVGSGGAAPGHTVADIAAKLVLNNNVLVGSVNANKRHWYKASQALLEADRAWLARLITRREEPESFEKALQRTPDDIKVVLQFAEV